MSDFDETATDIHNDALDEGSDNDLDSYISDDMSPNGRFVWITEDVVVDVLTGNQYMPKR